MNSQDEQTIREIAKYFQDKGYAIGSSEGVMGGIGNEACIGVLAPRKKLINTKFLKMDSPKKSEYFASLYLNPDQELDKVDKEWMMIIYGNKNEHRFDKFLEELEEKYRVHIQKFINPKTHEEYDAIL